VICQKRHKARFAYENSEKNYVNCCPGVCVDASGGDYSVSSALVNEFYLNSHNAIQGTAKACKYSLIYDEIGFKISELEILTYWVCYLYARCNKSVSLATPAYYAHWASKRAKSLFAAGARDIDLGSISNLWANAPAPMFFI
jgi:eukaryotic translation initiation factor 2C